MNRKQAEQRALELFVKYKDPDNRLNRENASNQLQRIAYLKCWEDMNEQQEQKVDYQKMFANCNQPNQLREAAEKVLHTYRNSPTEEPIIEALQELEKAVNQNK